MRFPKESIQVIRNNYFEKEEIRSKRVNFVQQVENQTASSRENPDLQSLLKFTAKGTRANLVSKSASLDITNRVSMDANNTQLGFFKRKLDPFSRAFPAIKKEIMRK